LSQRKPVAPLLLFKTDGKSVLRSSKEKKMACQRSAPRRFAARLIWKSAKFLTAGNQGNEAKSQTQAGTARGMQGKGMCCYSPDQHSPD